jgi:phosphate transport system protein
VNLGSHLEESLQRDIGRIRSQVSRMAALGELALEQSLQALVEGNRQLAYTVILRDGRIDEMENELDRLCLEFLVRQQPVAAHLRFVYTTIKLNKELERIGDYAESVARQVLIVSALEQPPPYAKFVELGTLAIRMVREAVRSFMEQDADLARQATAIEEQANKLRNAINADLLNLRREERLPLEALTPLLTIARRFERVTDQAKNICEEVLYMCTGEFMRHQAREVFRVLFVDGGNACLSQMAEGIGNSLGAARCVFSSAGIAPQAVDERAAQFLAGKGLDISRQFAKALDQVPHLEHYQVIVALDEAGAKAFPAPPTKTVCLTWAAPDPAQLQDQAGEVQAVFAQACEFLRHHIRDLVQAAVGNNQHHNEQESKSEA